MALLSIKLKSYLKGTKLGTFLRRRKWNRDILSETAARSAVAKRLPERSAEEQERIVRDILDMARKYRFNREEYFYYHFEEKSEDERKEFISDFNRVDFCESLNDPRNLYIFDSKFKTAELFGKYYGRDICPVKGKRDAEKLLVFLKKHEKFILKPVFGACGKGIEILKLDPSNENAVYEFVDRYSSKYSDGFIVEELIAQVPEMAQFHPSSINTVRVATVKFDDGVEIIGSFFRTGRNGSVVDNAGAGGVFGTIDAKSGVVLATGDEFGNSYEKHPDTLVQMVGFTIPKWDEAVALVKELATVVKGNRYAGWDLALTEKGWVMIEGNARGQFVWQIPTQKGFLAEANAILKRLNMPPLKVSV